MNVKGFKSGDDHPNGAATRSVSLKDWIAGGLWVLVVIPAWLYVGYSVLVPATAEEPLEIASSFDADEAAYIHQAGDNVIDGRVFVRLWSGEEVPCAGHTVQLVPQTALARERMDRLYGEAGLRRHVRNPVKLQKPDPRYWDYMREAPCDDQGRFRFEGVADGGYFVVGSVSWRGLHGHWQAGSLMQAVEVRSGEAVNLVLTPRSET